MLPRLAETLLMLLQQLPPQQANPQIKFYLLLAPLWTLLALLALAEKDSPAAARLSFPKHVRWAFLPLLFANITLTRVPVVLDFPLNPDEGLYLGTAQRLTLDPMLWRAADPETSGPLNIYPILIARLFGIPLNYAWLHLLAALILAATLCVLIRAAEHLADRWLARLALLPVAFMAAAWHYADLVHYSSEYMPNLMLAIALWIAAWLYTAHPTSGKAAFAGAMLALAPLSKLQVLPPLALIACVILIRLRTPMRIVAFLAGSGTTLVIFAILLVSNGAWTDFWNSYVLRNLAWANHFQKPFEYAFTWPIINTFRGLDQGTFYWGALTLCLISVALLLRRGTPKQTRLLLAFSLLFFISTVYAAGRPGSGIWHHLLIMLTGTAALFLALMSAQSRIAPRLTALLLVLFLLLLAGKRTFDNDHPVLALLLPYRNDSVIDLATSIRVYTKPRERLAHWGWNPHLAQAAQLMPATRYSTIAMQATSTGTLRDFFVQQFARDLAAERPPVVIDTTGMCGDLIKERNVIPLSQTPPVWSIVQRDYQHAGDLPCGILYVRRDRFQETHRQ